MADGQQWQQRNPKPHEDGQLHNCMNSTAVAQSLSSLPARHPTGLDSLRKGRASWPVGRLSNRCIRGPILCVGAERHCSQQHVGP